MEVGRLAEAAGDEKSAKPPMRFELPPGDINTKTDSYKILEKKKKVTKAVFIYLL